MAGAAVSRGPGERGVRLALAAAAVVVGVLACTFSLAQFLAERDPAFAYRLAPFDGRVAARLASSIAVDGAGDADRRRADRLAKTALARDPTAVLAISTLGINADLAGDRAGARRLFAHAQMLSRRDLRTQLWMIEDAVERQNVTQALHQYDMTLRVFPSLSELLYPVLAAASGDPAIRGALVNKLKGAPPWTSSLLNFMADSGPDARATAAVLDAARGSGIAVPEYAASTTVDALIGAGHIEAAWRYYATLNRGNDRRRSRDPRFTAALAMPSLLDWKPLGNAGISATLQDGLFDFAAPASVGGAMLQQFQMLPPGQYRLVGHSQGIDQADGALPYWLLSCQDERRLGRVVVTNSAAAGGTFSGAFRVPADCPVQKLLLVASPSGAISGLSGQIDRVALMPDAQ